MTIAVKICGLNAPKAVEAAVEGGASMVGFVFYQRSPRSIDPATAAQLGSLVPKKVKRVGLIVDETDQRISEILGGCKLELLQLHGDETPQRCLEIRKYFGLPLIKAIKIGSAGDLGAAQSYTEVVDYLLFDARPPASLTNALPGGNAVSFDWSMLRERKFDLPWLLSGGLSVQNIERAIQESGATRLDVSSGVEDRPGVKNPKKIAEFLALAHKIGGI